MKHVIIGTGPAGVIAAETLRKQDRDASITLIGDEPERPYSRMAIPYHLIGDIAEAGTHLRKGGNHFDQLNIEMVQQRVQQLDAQNKTLTFPDGQVMDYDKLLLATGSKPIRPPIPGMMLDKVVSCWTLEDARKIIAGAQAGDDVILMGAGFIGCIILEALARRGVNLTVVEMGNRMVPRMMDERSGNLIKTWCENKGVNVLTSTRVTAVREQDGGSKLLVEMEGREPLSIDLLICATGVKPNTDLADDLLETGHGILVNGHLQTSNTDIYAAGDVAEGRDFSTGEYSVQAIQPTAADHGYHAAINMAGGDSALKNGTLNMNVLDTMGLISTSFGAWEGVDGGDSSAVYDDARYRYVKLEFQDDVLVGANTLGMTQHVGVLRGLVQNKTPLGKWKDKLLADPTRVMEAWLAHRVP